MSIRIGGAVGESSIACENGRRMAPRYIVRFDDICPTMNWTVWDEVEAVLIDHGVRPLLAVVPDNRDPGLAVAPERSDFWDRVRQWQSASWTIALHGHQHVYKTNDAGVLGFNAFSEFAGVPREQQEEGLRAALAIFEAQGVQTDTWIAPAHSFDETTLELLPRFGFHRISDGFFARPGIDRRGLLWIPQQLWRLAWRPAGVWTVCYHINAWSRDDVTTLRRDLARFAAHTTDFDSVSDAYRRRRLTRSDRLTSSLYRRFLHTEAALSRAVRTRLARG
jgi:predicted deacetylase